jgi:alkylation response protein AidB-like acyl-CoA dehydrogenase
VIARPVDGGWSLSGRKIFISGGDVARYVCVFAVLAGEGAESLTCFLVSPGCPASVAAPS